MSFLKLISGIALSKTHVVVLASLVAAGSAFVLVPGAHADRPAAAAEGCLPPPVRSTTAGNGSTNSSTNLTNASWGPCCPPPAINLTAVRNVMGSNGTDNASPPLWPGPCCLPPLPPGYGRPGNGSGPFSASASTNGTAPPAPCCPPPPATSAAPGSYPTPPLRCPPPGAGGRSSGPPDS
jgi:hypothetical protein